MTAHLEVIGLEKRYGATRALDHVSFSVARGEMFGLLGPNGAGKTTLLSILSLLLEPTKGEARLDGQVLRARDFPPRRKIGIVPQELALYGELTARENLVFFGRLYGISGKRLTDRVERVLQAIGLSDRADERSERFSGGMKRRLNLGAALVHEPALLLLDEPTIGVDPQSRNHLFEEIRRVNAAGTTIIYTSHYMEEVQALCPRVGILDHGRLIACDALGKLLQALEGLIRFRVRAAADGAFLQRLEQIDGVRVERRDDHAFSLTSKDVKRALGGLLALLGETRLELASLEIEEPNLERVFLHLTGRALRD